jgi:hypothetical protein
VGHKRLEQISMLKCDVSNKQKYDSDSDEIEQSAKITANQFLSESLKLTRESRTKMNNTR